MQMFNVYAIKNRQEVSLVYCTNRTKKVNGENENENHWAVQSP